MKLKETIKKELPKTTKGKILGIVFGIVTPILVGVGAGIIINKFFLGKSVDYSNVDNDKLSVNRELIMQKYNDAKASGDYESALLPYEMVNVGYFLYSDYENAHCFTKGYVHASVVTQSIRGITIKNGNNYLEESLSKSSLVDVATRTYLNEDNSINFYRGSADTEVTATWNETEIPYTADQYKEDFGKTPMDPLIYIVNDYSVIKGSSTVTKDNDNYVISLKLNPTRGVVKYVKQMKTISDLADYPAFEECSLTFTLDKNLLIKQMDVQERYYAKTKSGVGSDSAGYVTVTYFVDSDIKIPALNESISYPEVN